MYIGQNIKVLRKRNGINQTELGKRLGVTNASISGYENGANIPGVETLVKIAQILKVSIDDLILRDIEKEGTSENPIPISEETDTQKIKKINQLQALRIRELEREIKRHHPELAVELGIE